MTPGVELEDLEQRHHILSLVRKLPPKQAQVMALTLDGATPAEIAVTLRCTSDQVRSNLRLARRKLVALMQDTGQEQEQNR
jgi:RNA polymerase sigma-70 factor (ECF subfamily)